MIWRCGEAGMRKPELHRNSVHQCEHQRSCTLLPHGLAFLDSFCLEITGVQLFCIRLYRGAGVVENFSTVCISSFKDSNPHSTYTPGHLRVLSAAPESIVKLYFCMGKQPLPERCVAFWVAAGSVRRSPGGVHSSTWRHVAVNGGNVLVCTTSRKVQRFTHLAATLPWVD